MFLAGSCGRVSLGSQHWMDEGVDDPTGGGVGEAMSTLAGAANAAGWTRRSLGAGAPSRNGGSSSTTRLPCRRSRMSGERAQS